MATTLKKIIAFLAKAFVIYLMLIALWIALFLFGTAIPRYGTFEHQPFVQSAILALAISALISHAGRSKTPAIFTAVCLGYSGLFFVFPHQAALFIAFFCLVAAISFFYRNKITEPLLAMLPVIAGTWVFLCFVYPSYLVAWVSYISNQKDFGGSAIAGFEVARSQIAPSLALLLPVLAMYFLGKQSYAKLYAVLKRCLQRKAAFS